MYGVEDLGFLETMKLVNYVRREVRNQNKSPDVSSKSAFEDDRYLQPVLEDDALLYTLEDAIGYIEASKNHFAEGVMMTDHICPAKQRVVELEGQLEVAQAKLAECKEMLSRVYENPFSSDADSFTSSSAHLMSRKGAKSFKDDDTHYFKSYSYNGESTQDLEIYILTSPRNS